MLDKEGGGIVAIDYGGYSFLPPSFFALALEYGPFAYKLTRMLDYPPCKDNTNALICAAGVLVPYGTNKVGEQIILRSLLPFPLSCLNFWSTVRLQGHGADYTAQAFRNGSGTSWLRPHD